MGICISSLSEGCCESLNLLGCIDGDTFDNNNPTVDNIYECNDRYILIEEKSFLLDFFRESCKGRKKFSHFINAGELKESYFEFLATLSLEEKRVIFQQSAKNLLDEMPDKVNNTHRYLKDVKKAEKSINLLLYCNSGTEIDKLASLIFAKYNNEEKHTVLECSKLEKFLEIKGCA
ncbi:MAG: hypothetical protein KN64_10680 [Sulfurovum sp. AS07-7]|nr:MAG: hypothetical protein KN64_10680 [Sulfurovum sp. AS07-7]